MDGKYTDDYITPIYLYGKKKWAMLQLPILVL